MSGLPHLFPGPPPERAAPVLPAADLDAALAFYVRLGFRAARVYPPPASYAIMVRGALELHLFAMPEVDPRANSSGCYLRVPDVAALHASWVPLLPGLAPLVDQPYGQREFHLVDPSGNLLRIGSPIPDGPRRLRVAVACTRSYENPIAAAAGEVITVEREDPDEPDWFWCRGPDGREGWVFRSFFVADGHGHRLVRDYDAAELDLAEGDLLVALEEAGGWLRCATTDGRVGWVRASRVAAAPTAAGGEA